MKPIKLSQFPEDTYIFIKTKKRKEIFDKLEKKLKFLTRSRNIDSGALYDWRLGFMTRKGNKKIKRYIPLPKLKIICKEININIDDLQPYIQEIKTSSRSGVIKEPKLPLKVTQNMFSLLGHFIGDGYGGEIGRSAYTNTSEEARNNFIRRLKKVFGDVEYSTNPNHPNLVGVSKIVPKILKKYFGISDFRNGKPRITKKVYNAPREHIIEFIKAIVIDEGSIRDEGIEIGICANPTLTKQIKFLCEKRLDYSCKSYKHTFRISTKNYQRVLDDMQDLVIKEKQEKLVRIIRRKSRGWYSKGKGSTKKDIVKLLLQSPKDVKELSKFLDMQASGIRNQIKGYLLKGKKINGLIELDIVKLKGNGYRNIEIFEICNKNKAISFLGESI